MSLFRLFGGRTAEDHEHRADKLADAAAWGKAKIAYDHALDKLEKSSSDDKESTIRLQEKIDRCKEALAARHQSNAQEMMEGGAHAEAGDLVRLALELSTDSRRRSELERLLQDIERYLDVETGERGPMMSYEEPDETQVFEATENEVLQALYSTLPEEVQQAYLTYGENFAAGYQALNRGDFETAVDNLTRAMQDTPSPDSYIPLELATGYLNLGRHSEARQLLEPFIESHPHVLPAYQMLCEILWENGEFDRADELLAAVTPLLEESVAVYLLKGETLLQSGDYESAKGFYSRFMQAYGWNESVALSLARAHEAQAETAEARTLYGEMMQRCTGCGSRIDPLIKQKYADLSFAAGERTTAVLELYLSLAREMPQTTADCYEKISRIYAAQGNTSEERRFRSFAAAAREHQADSPNF